MANFYDDLPNFSAWDEAPPKDAPSYDRFHLWAVRESGRLMSPFNMYKLLGLTLMICFSMIYVHLTDLKGHPIFDLSTWLSEKQLPYALMTWLSYMTWRISLNCECVIMGRDSYAPSYIRSAIFYLNLFGLLFTALLCCAVYRLSMLAYPELAIVFAIGTAIVGWYAFRIRKGSRINAWFNSAAGRHLFPICQRTDMPANMGGFLILYLIWIIAAIVYFSFKSFVLPT